MILVYLFALYTLGFLSPAIVEGNSVPQSSETLTYLAKKVITTYLAKKVITKVVFDKQGADL